MEGSEEEGACFYQQWKNFPVHEGLTKYDLCIRGSDYTFALFPI